MKFGTQIQQTRKKPASTNFSLGITNPALNPICLGAGRNRGGPPPRDESLRLRHRSAFTANPNLLTRPRPYDLTAAVPSSSIMGKTTSRRLPSTPRTRSPSASLCLFGARLDRYNGLVSQTAPQPRLGISYLVKRTGTVLRHRLLAHHGERLLTRTCCFRAPPAPADSRRTSLAPKPACRPATRREESVQRRFQQKVTRYLIFDGDYFWKYTHNAYDFDVCSIRRLLSRSPGITQSRWTHRPSQLSQFFMAFRRI